MRSRRAAAAGLALSLAAAPAAAQTFTNVTQESGLQAVRDMKAADIWLSGLNFVDLDGDGDLDFYFGAHHGEGGLAGLNDGRGKFAAANLLPPTEIHLAYDLNEDGRIDLTMTDADDGTRWILNNSKPGMLSFASAFTRRGYSRMGAMADMDSDGSVDWVIGGGPGGTSEEAIWIIFGDGKGGFRPTIRTILLPMNKRDTAVPFPLDFDADGDTDLIARWTGGNRVLRNDGTNDGNLTLTQATDTGIPDQGFSIAGAGDVDHDGDMDILGFESGVIAALINDGKGRFTKKSGLLTGPAPSKPTYGGGVATVTDLDNDGVGDVLVGGALFLHVLRGVGGVQYAPMNQAWGIVGNAGGVPDSGFAFGDIDGDGDLDLAGFRVSNRQFNVYRNDLPSKNWIKVRPVGLAGRRGAMGAKIYVYEAGTDKLLWFDEVLHFAWPIQQNQYGFAETERHFGLGSRTTVDVAVHFRPSNKLVKKMGVAANTTIRIGEDGSGAIVPPANPPLPPARAGTPDAGAGAPGSVDAGDARAGAVTPDALRAADDARGGGSSEPRADAATRRPTADDPTGDDSPGGGAAGAATGCQCRSAGARAGGGRSAATLGAALVALCAARRRRRPRP